MIWKRFSICCCGGAVLAERDGAVEKNENQDGRGARTEVLIRHLRPVKPS